MTNDRMALAELLEKGADGDLLREMIGYVAQRLMDLDVVGLVGADHGERAESRENWRNVYININAWLPKYISPSLLAFMKSKTGSGKVLFGSNGLSWDRYLDQIDELGIRDEARQAILCDNPRRVYNP